jgi:Flp pilus assembly protein TadG
MTATSHSRDRSEDGAVIVEFAVIFIVFVALLWGLISYGVIFAAQQSMAHAASEGARTGAGVADQAGAIAAAEGVAYNQLSWLGSDDPADGLEVTVTIDPCDYDATRNCLVVETTYDWANFPIVPSLLDISTPNTLTSRAVVQHS